MVGVITIPAGVAFLLFGPVITRVLFFGIGRADAVYIGYVLSALGVGLVAFSINIILVRGFNAFEDTRTQVLSILFINVISVALSYLSLAALKNQWVTVGLGVAFSMSYIVGLFITLALLSRHTGRISFGDFSGQHNRLLVASLLAMLPLFAISQYFNWVSNDSTAPVRVAELGLVLLMSPVAYYYSSKFLGVGEITVMSAMVKGQFRKARKIEGNKSA